MWAKTMLEATELDENDGRSYETSSPNSTGSVETYISSYFGGINYPSLFSSKPSTYGASQSLERLTSRFCNSSTGVQSSFYEGPCSPTQEEPSSYSSVMQRYESSKNPLAGKGLQSFGSPDDDQAASGNPQFGTALYDFTAGGDDELNLTAGEEGEIDYEVDDWFYVKKKRPGRDGKMAGLVPGLYVGQS